MLDLFSTPRLKTFLPRLSEFVKDELLPIEHLLLDNKFSDLEQNQYRLAREKAKKEGFFTPHLPENEGGLGFSLAEFGQVSEVLGYCAIGHYVCNCQAPDIGNMELLHGFASKSLQKRYLKPLQEGNIRSCFAMTEPEFAGSNPVMMATKATRDGNEYVIEGHKWFTTGAEGAAFAVVMAITNPDSENPYGRASMLIVPTETQGYRLVRNISVMGESGSGWMSHAEVRFDNCRVPVENLIGAEGDGFRLAQERLGAGRIHHCMRWIGICERAFEMMCQHAATRQISSKETLAHKQSVQFRIAECRANIDAARLMTLNTAQQIDEKGASAVRLQISTIKFFVADVLRKVLEDALQIHGALGMTDDTMLAFWYRHERAARIYDGADEVHKQVVAREILKNYGVKL